MTEYKSLDFEPRQHTAAHILAQAVLQMFPKTKLGIGPVTETGFSYEFDIPGVNKAKLQTSLPALEKLCAEIVTEELPLVQIFYGHEEAEQLLLQQGQLFKHELISQIPDPEISFYRTGSEFVDLCRGPHLGDTGKVGEIHLETVEYNHWLGDNKRPKLLTIRGRAFKDEAEYEQWVAQRKTKSLQKLSNWGEEANIISPQNRFLMPHGIGIKRILQERLEESLRTNDFLEVEPLNQKDEGKEIHAELLEKTGIARYFYYNYYNTKDETLFNTHTQLCGAMQVTHQSTPWEEAIQMSLRYFRTVLPRTGKYLMEIDGSNAELVRVVNDYCQQFGVEVNAELTSDSEGDVNCELYYENELGEHLLTEWSLTLLPSKRGRRNTNSIIGKLTVVFTQSLEKLLELVLEEWHINLPFDLRPVQVTLIAQSDNALPSLEKLESELLAEGLRVELYEPGELSNASTQGLLPAQYIISAGDSEQRHDSFQVAEANGSALGLMSEEELLKLLLNAAEKAEYRV